jgi:galactoside O-acetyltransferase
MNYFKYKKYLLINKILNFNSIVKKRGLWNLILFVIEKYLNKIYSYHNKLKIKSCGLNFNVQYPVTIVDGNNIKIGTDFRSLGNLYLYADEGEIEIGNNISLNTNVIIGASGGKILIGDNVLIGPNTVLRAANHGIKLVNTIKSQNYEGGTINIKNDVWIGSNVVILKNVTIEVGTVVAAGSVVNKNTKPYSIVGGVPAKIIKYRK